MTTEPGTTTLAGRRLIFLGKLTGMNRREVTELVRQHGGTVLTGTAETADLAVVGESELPLRHDGASGAVLDGDLAEAAARGTLEVIGESELWERLGLLEPQQHVHRLYTPAMLAELLGVSVAIIRRWHRRGLIQPSRVVRRLPYFDFQEVATARRLAELLAAGATPQSIAKQLRALDRFLPQFTRPLAQLSVIVEGRELLLRQGEGLVEPGGQLRFDFESWVRAPEISEEPATDDLPPDVDDLVSMAGELEDQGRLREAATLLRTALAAAQPTPETCFRLAEVLYRQGDPSAARERYFMTLELDEDFVEARFNLGCVLAELGDVELASATFRGALAQHPDYADAHFHLARLLDRQGTANEALPHWQRFLELAPDSPWAAEARGRLESEDCR